MKLGPLAVSGAVHAVIVGVLAGASVARHPLVEERPVEIEIRDVPAPEIAVVAAKTSGATSNTPTRQGRQRTARISHAGPPARPVLAADVAPPQPPDPAPPETLPADAAEGPAIPSPKPEGTAAAPPAPSGSADHAGGGGATGAAEPGPRIGNGPPDAATKAATAAYLAEVRRRILANRRYPDEARRALVEGRVLVRVRISAAGQVERSGVIESEDEILALAARRAIADAAPFPPSPLVRAVELDVPIVFRLDD